METIKILSELFRKKYGIEPEDVKRLPGAGSGRVYYRLSSGNHVCIGVKGENLRDCRAFISLSHNFREIGIKVPEIYGVSESELYYIQEDLGEESLFSILKEKRGEEMVAAALKSLAKMQCSPASVWERNVAYPPFSPRQIHWDLNYFKYEYLRPSSIDFDEDKLQDDFELLCADLMELSSAAEGFMYRDFQSRNVMIKSGECRFIDFQGGRRGPSLYDAVSFLWQARAGFSPEFRERMLEEYAKKYCEMRPISKDELLKGVDLFVLFRTLQVLGAYGLRGLVERKAHFIESIPGALQNLKDIKSSGVLDKYPELKRVAEKLIEDTRFKMGPEDERLTVEVYSFSYKKGYPENYTGNGGGFMFDCRGMHNPGRYAEYKNLTGLDRPVIEFLRKMGETDRFSERAFELVSPTVDRYLKRGFRNLQIGFGCTGGQHRSVYCAECVSRLLSERFPEARVVVKHREQGIEKEVTKM